MADITKLTPEESFKNSLEDVKVIVEKLQPHCESIDDLVAQVNLGIENRHHLQLMIAFMKSQSKK